MIPQGLFDDVKKLFAGDYSGHDYFHSIRVMDLAASLAEAEGNDKKGQPHL